MKKIVVGIVLLMAAITELMMSKAFKVKVLKDGTTIAGEGSGGSSTCGVVKGRSKKS